MLGRRITAVEPFHVSRVEANNGLGNDRCQFSCENSQDPEDYETGQNTVFCL